MVMNCTVASGRPDVRTVSVSRLSGGLPKYGRKRSTSFETAGLARRLSKAAPRSGAAGVASTVTTPSVSTSASNSPR